MVWFPLLLIPVGTILFLFLNSRSNRRQRRLAVGYRGRYVQMVASLDHLVRRVRHLVDQGGAPGDTTHLDHLEGTVLMMETLLEVFRGIRPLGGEMNHLYQAGLMIRELEKRVKETEGLLPPRPSSRRAPGPGPVPGCWFCARPWIAGLFSRIRVGRAGQDQRPVYSCHYCRDELRYTGRIRTLYLPREGDLVHWSEAGFYRPDRDFWRIEELNPVYKRPEMELVREEIDS